MLFLRSSTILLLDVRLFLYLIITSNDCAATYLENQ
jgi:hypothetical protein